MIKTALQLYTVRSHTARNMLSTLRTLGAMGYRTVELSGYGNATPRDIRGQLDDLEMHALGAHIDLEHLRIHLQQVLSDMQTLGCRYVVIPWIAPQLRVSLFHAHHLAEEFNHFGAILAEEGLSLVYHNYVADFAPLEGSSLWYELLTHTDPALVHFELDIYWAKYAGVDPLDLLEQHAERIPLLHCKDMAADHVRADVPVGKGIIPWRQIFAACDPALEYWAIVEQDHPRNALESVQSSLHYVRQLLP